MSREKQIIEMRQDICKAHLCSVETHQECIMTNGECWKCRHIAEALYNAGYRKQSEVVGEIISLIELRMAKNKENRKGVQSEVWQSIYEGREDAYKDIKEIIEQKYGAKMKGGAE